MIRCSTCRKPAAVRISLETAHGISKADFCSACLSQVRPAIDAIGLDLAASTKACAYA